jgi:hypothetical protein
MDNWISHRNKLAKKVQYVTWTEKEENYLLKVILEAVEKGARVDMWSSIEGIEKLTGFKRSYGSVENKLGRLRATHGHPGNGRCKGTSAFDPANYPIHPDLTLLEQDFSAGSKGIYALVCNKGHHLQVEAQYWKSTCRECFVYSFAGGLPSEDDCRDALVYLIYTEKINKLKVGYTTGKGIEAIKKRFISWPIPYEYEIIAYDQSTAGLASRHEQWLLKNTKEYQTFEQGGKIKFDGYTEFRNAEVLKQLLPEYETVLDTAFRI